MTISIPKYYAIQNDFRRFFEITLEYTFIRYEVCIKWYVSTIQYIQLISQHALKLQQMHSPENVWTFNLFEQWIWALSQNKTDE